MANTYCDYYDSVGATAYATYHGCVEEPVVDSEIVGGTCSIEPCVAGNPPRIDQGATWWCDYRWDIGGESIDLGGYNVTATLYYADGTAFVTLTEGQGITKDDTQFRVKITDEQTDTIDFGRSDIVILVLDIDLERTESTDAITGYEIGDVVRASAGEVFAHSRGAGVGVFQGPQDIATYAEKLAMANPRACQKEAAGGEPGPPRHPL